jgi:hypothetical protein
MHKLTKHYMISLIGIVLFGFILSACRSAEPEFDIDAQKTGFAQTADVQASLTSAARPTATETPVPLPTYTPTKAVTNTPVNTPTKGNETTAPPAGGVNRAQVIGQTPDDNTTFKPGEAFTVTWTVENRGTTTWSVNYYVEFAFGEQMGAQDKVFIWLPVPPETNLPISVNLVAPETPGTKVSNWKLFDQNGTAFYDLSVTIIVGE